MSRESSTGFETPLHLDRLPLAHISMDANFRIQEWNLAATEIFGFDKKEVLGANCVDLILTPAEFERLHEVVRRIRAGDMHAHSVNENKTKDGRTIVCRWFNTPIMAAEGGFLGLISLAQDVTQHRNSEKALLEFAERVHALSRRLIDAQESDRRFLAKELHDEIGQHLTGLKLLLDPYKAGHTDQMNVRLAEARAIVDELLRKVRSLSFDLRPEVLDQLGLYPALFSLFERFARQSGIHVDFFYDGPRHKTSPDVETAAYRIIQEALTNVVRHAGVRDAHVSVQANGDYLQLEIEDRGCGFDPGRIVAYGASTGLPGMRERALLLGGELTVHSGNGQGTRIIAKLPLKEYS